MKNNLLWLIFLCLLPNFPGLAQTKKELKEQRKTEAYQHTKSLISEGEFKFTAEWLTPRSGRQVNLTTNYNELIIKNDTIKADLPYFGVVQIPSINSNAGIQFEQNNVPIELEFNDKKRKIILSFKAQDKSESFDFKMTIFGGGSTTIFVTSTHRNPITYDGNISPLDKTKNQ